MAIAMAIATAIAVLVPTALGAQSDVGTRSGATRPAPAGALETTTPQLQGEPLAPPITPRRAFLTSLLIPGAGQARLDRPYAGGLFVALEVAALTLRHRSAEDLRIARRFRADSMPLRYQTDAVTGLVARDTLGNPVVAAWQTSRYTDAFIRTRRLHLEDWTAALIFNHLFAGADAFVAAQLWDLPQKVGFRQTPFGSLLSLTFAFGGPQRQ